MNTNLSPVISIITVTYNAASFIVPTMESVFNQSYNNIEYIVVDGASEDTTVELIGKYQSQIAQFISEPDEGLYDAMNKGIKLATGDFILFLNAGDTLYSKDTITNSFELYEASVDVLYGETMMIDEVGKNLGTRSETTRRKLPKNMTWEDMKFGMVVCHQSFIVRKEIAPFYIQNNLCADIDWVINCLKSARKIINTNQIISNFLIGGVSKQQQKKSLKDRFFVYQKQFGILSNWWIHLVIAYKVIVFRFTNNKTD